MVNRPSVCLKPSVFNLLKMGEGIPYHSKWMCGCIGVLLIIVVILASIISIGGESSAEVEMNGDNDSSNIEQSSGFHMVEVNGADLGMGSKDGKSGWSWLEFVVIVLGVIILLNCSHIAHYFLCTRSMVNKKVVRNVELEMNRLTAPTAAPLVADGVVIVPGLNQA